MVKMEKYCIKCRKAYDNMKYNNCPICTTELIEREIRTPIPSELRHKIFVRDGYRCRECGKNNHETSLEIDHIFPLSQGGRTTEDNLQVLCTECNRAKKDDEWKDKEIEITRNALSNLKNQLHNAEKDLKSIETEEEEYALKAKIKDYKKNKIPKEEEKLEKLIKEEQKINSERKAQQEENRRRKNLYNKLYVQLEDELFLEVCNHFSLTEKSDEDNIRLLISKHDEQEIYSTIASIEKELKEEARRKELFDKLNNTLSSNEINLFVREFSFQGSKDELLNYLIYNFSEEEIESLKIKLFENEQKRLAIEECANRINNLHKSLSKKDIFLFSNKLHLPLDKTAIINYLVDTYSDNQIETLRIKLYEEYKKRNDLIDQLLNDFEDNDFTLFVRKFSLSPDTNRDVAEYLVDKFSKEEIYNLNLKLKKDELIKNIKLSIDVKQLISLCKYFSLTPVTKDNLIKHLENCSIDTITKAVEYIEK